MRLLLDTSYLMPLIRIAVKGIEIEEVEKALKEHQTIVSEIQIFELYAKGIKYTIQQSITLEDVIQGVEATHHSLERIPLVERQIMKTAAQATKETEDLIDAIILATALHHAEALATLDPKMIEAYENPELKKINPNLQIIKI